MGAVPKDLLIDGEFFEDIDGFLYDNDLALSATDKELIEDIINGVKRSGYIGGGHMPVYFICAASD